MKKIFLLALFSLLVTSSAFSSSNFLDNLRNQSSSLMSIDNLLIENFKFDPRDIVGSLLKLKCKDLNISPEQRAQIKEAYIAHKDFVKLITAEVSQRYVQMNELIDDVHSTLEDARLINNDIVGLYAQVISSKKDMKAKILFEILNPDQRRPAIKCSKLGLKDIVKKVCSTFKK